MNLPNANIDTAKQVTVELGGLALVLDCSGTAYALDEATLLVADLHFEKASSLAPRGIYLPPYDTAATLEMLSATVARYQPRRIVCLGDSFHDVSGHERLSEVAYDGISALATGRDWVWITGNHDPETKITLPGSTCDELKLRGVALRHQPQFMEGMFEIAGHLHPCARIEQRGRSLRRRCFAVNKNHMILPAIGALTGSLNVLDKSFKDSMSVAGARAVMLGQTGVYAISPSRLLPDQ